MPVLLAAFLFLAFGLWLVPRTLGRVRAGRFTSTSRVQRLSETWTDAVDTRPPSCAGWSVTCMTGRRPGWSRWA